MNEASLSMALSRHLYAFDEVHAALIYTCQRSDVQETVFWCRELLESGCLAEAVSTLFMAWMWHRGPFDLQWLVRASVTLAADEIVEEEVLISAYHLSQRCIRDHSLWDILTSHTVPDRVTPRTPSCATHLARNTHELFFLRALYQGKAHSAWWMACHLETSRVWELLHQYVDAMSPYASSYRVCFHTLIHYESLLGYRSEDSNVLCLAVLSACLSPAQQEHSFRILSTPSGLADPTPETSIRRARRYSIPTACLYGHTARGRMTWKQSTLRLLRTWSGNDTCPFWEMHGIDAHVSDDRREAFYDRFFPDDPPDEWTLAEQQRSHGDGVLSPSNPVCTMEKYASLFLHSVSRFFWKGKTAPIIHSAPITPWVSVPLLQTPVDPAFLVPVVRRLRIVG
jgi:hypothetical protein